MTAPKAPYRETLTADVPAAGAAVVQDQIIGEVPFAATVVEVSLLPEGAVANDPTNYRTFRVLNKGQAGSGNLVVASRATNNAAGALVAKDEELIDLTATLADRAVAEGDVLAADEIVAGTGVAHTGYEIKVTIERS